LVVISRCRLMSDANTPSIAGEPQGAHNDACTLRNT
jgi:hypothetical protein